MGIVAAWKGVYDSQNGHDMKNSRPRRVCKNVLPLLVLTQVCYGQNTRYQFVDLSNGYSGAFTPLPIGVNNLGQAVVEFNGGPDGTASGVAVFSPPYQAPMFIPPLAGDTATAGGGISDAGVVGCSYSPSVTFPNVTPILHPFIFSLLTGTQPLPLLPGYRGACAIAISKNGTILGAAMDAQGSNALTFFVYTADHKPGSILALPGSSPARRQ